MNTQTPRFRSTVRTTGVSGALLAGFVLTSCSPLGPVAERPAESSPPASSPTPSAEARDLLAEIDPCTLVPGAARAELALTDPQSKELAGVPVCRFRVEGKDLRSSYTVSVELFGDVGLTDIWSPDTERLPGLGSHQAVRFSGPGESCRVALAVTDSSRVDVAAVGGDWWPGCELAIALATFIEPQVP